MNGFTLFHVLLSLVGIAAGFVVVGGWLSSRQLGGWTSLFLITTAATSITGFFFSVQGSHSRHRAGSAFADRPGGGDLRASREAQCRQMEDGLHDRGRRRAVFQLLRPCRTIVPAHAGAKGSGSNTSGAAVCDFPAARAGDLRGARIYSGAAGEGLNLK